MREKVLNDINAQANNNKKTKMKNETQHYFIMMKQLTILGYFSSETGCTQALNYIAVPSKI
ncbi:MAG: gluconate 2-dehydrogenase subunit 3 family protein [Saprospiraceae bacterium]|nr:gluconate 2-dehydrogenase subunit 3 family protein [Saprospiraceae bacterium]